MPDIKDEIKTVVTELLEKEKTEREVNRKFTPSAGKEPKVEVTLDEADKPFASLGEYMIAVKNAGGGGAYIREPRLKRCIPGALNPHTKAPTGLGETVPSDGGFLVAQEFIPNLLQKVWDTGAVISRCARQPVGANFNGVKLPVVDETSRADGSRWGGVRAYWAAEAGTITASKPTFKQISLELQKLTGLCVVTDELLEDSVALEGFVNRWFPAEFGFKLDDAVINGTGAGMPLGILASPARYAITKETGQVAATIVTNNILKMFKSMYGPSVPNAVWLFNADCLTSLQSLTFPIGTGGAMANLYQFPGGGVNPGNPYGTILGRPAIPVEQCAAIGTEGDIMFVDLSQYIVIDKGGINAASSIHLYFATDQTAFRWVYRVNGQPVWSSYVTPYKGSTYVSPYVTLGARA